LLVEDVDGTCEAHPLPQGLAMQALRVIQAGLPALFPTAAARLALLSALLRRSASQTRSWMEVRLLTIVMERFSGTIPFHPYHSAGTVTLL
jgi:hypothetical protein